MPFRRMFDNRPRAVIFLPARRPRGVVSKGGDARFPREDEFRRHTGTQSANAYANISRRNTTLFPSFDSLDGAVVSVSDEGD